ncbi:MAG: hypothetical protein GKR90_02600 [Pseudomonadales bacterium]|nr:hypothetical protein [Pseudomonadales bacterium]
MTKVDLVRNTIGLDGSGLAQALKNTVPPSQIDGLMIGAPILERNPPHSGEIHPDGDEIIILVSGRLSVKLELPGGDQTIELSKSGEACIVRKGTWHQVFLDQESQVVHITPGPNGSARFL